MFEIGDTLEFAHGIAGPGSPEEIVEKQVVGLFQPKELVAAYLTGVQAYKSSDLVLVAAKHDPEVINPWPRDKYIEVALRRCTQAQLARFRLVQESAHQIAKLPKEYVAFWLVLEDRQAPVPIMTVLSMPYKTEAVN